MKCCEIFKDMLIEHDQFPPPTPLALSVLSMGVFSPHIMTEIWPALQRGPSINDVMLFWGIFNPPPPPLVMLFCATFNIVGHVDPKPPSPPPSGMTSFMGAPFQYHGRAIGRGGREGRKTPPPPFFGGKLHTFPM